MLFNCITCGKSISSKKDVCVYCKTDVSSFAADVQKERRHAQLKSNMETKYPGTLLSFLLRTK